MRPDSEASLSWTRFKRLTRRAIENERVLAERVPDERRSTSDGRRATVDERLSTSDGRRASARQNERTSNVLDASTRAIETISRTATPE
jgi:hypothetical protein